MTEEERAIADAIGAHVRVEIVREGERPTVTVTHCLAFGLGGPPEQFESLLKNCAEQLRGYLVLALQDSIDEVDAAEERASGDKVVRFPTLKEAK